eukprot:6190870-Pleurochrysis_carterae.AAC.2
MFVRMCVCILAPASNAPKPEPREVVNRVQLSLHRLQQAGQVVLVNDWERAAVEERAWRAAAAQNGVSETPKGKALQQLCDWDKRAFERGSVGAREPARARVRERECVKAPGGGRGRGLGHSGAHAPGCDSRLARVLVYLRQRVCFECLTTALLQQEAWCESNRLNMHPILYADMQRCAASIM